MHTIDLMRCAKKAARQCKFGNAIYPINFSADDKKAIRVAPAAIARGITTSQGYCRWCALHHFEVVCDFRTRLIC